VASSSPRWSRRHGDDKPLVDTGARTVYPDSMLRLALAALVVLAACDDSPVTIDDPAAFLAELRAAECAHLVRCRLFPDVATCEARMPYPGLPVELWISPPRDAAWPGHVAAGTMSYARDAAVACLASMRDLTCGRGDFARACFGVFRGAAPPGTVTSSPDECAAGGWRESTCNGACCTGTCETGDGVIDTGSTGAEGERCGPVPDGFESCQPRLTCREGVCVRLGAGDECAANVECPAGLACNGTCGPRPAEGDACVRRDGEDTCDHVGLRCDSTGHCRRFAVEGEACTADGAVPCRAGLACDDATGRCVGVLPGGAPCSEFPLCADGFYCDLFDADAVCAPKLLAGEACDWDSDCASGACVVGSDGHVCASVGACP
jgi:hypothetical protein